MAKPWVRRQSPQDEDAWKGSEWRTVDLSSERGRLLKEQLEAELNGKTEDRQMSEESKRARVLDFVTVNPEGVLLSRVVGQLGSGGAYAKNKLLVQRMAEEGLLRIGDLNGREAVWLVTPPKEEAAPDDSGVLRGKARVRAFDTIGQDLIEYRLHVNADNRRRDWLAINSVVDVFVSKVGIDPPSGSRLELAEELGRTRGELEVMREELEKAKAELEVMREAPDELTQQLDYVKSKCSQDMQCEREATKEAWCAKDQAVAELRQLQAHRDELAAKLSRTQAELDVMRNESERDLACERQGAAMFERDLDRAIAELEQVKAERDELRDNLEGANGIAERLQAERNRADIAERSLGLARGELERVKQQRDELYKLVDAVDHGQPKHNCKEGECGPWCYHWADERRSAIEQELEGCKRDRLQFDADRKVAWDELEEVKQQRDKLLIRVNAVDHRQAESKLALLERENDRLRADINHKIEANASLSKRCDELAEKLSKERGEHEQCRVQMKRQGELMQRACDRRDELAAKLNEARGDLERLQCQADGDVPMLRKRIEEMMTEGYELGEKLEREEAKVSALTHRHDKVAEQLARLRRQHARLLLELAAEEL